MEKLTHTKRRNFMNCHRYYYNSHVLHLSPRMEKQGRRRGRIFGNVLQNVQSHYAALAEIKDPDERDSAPELWQVISDTLDLEFDSIVEGGFIDAETVAALEIERVKIECMTHAYIERYGVDQRREVEFDLPLVNPKTNRSSRRFRRAGKIDGTVIVRPRHARIIEDKFVGQIQQVMIDRLPLDDQVSEYVDAFRSKGWTAEVDYRHTRFPGINPKPPKQYKTKDDYPGETLAEFADRLTEDIAERPEFYFDQQILMFTTDHLMDFQQGRWDVAQDIMATEKSKRWYRNPSRCWEYGGCEFIPLCTHQPDAMDRYIVVPDNPELNPETGAAVSDYATNEV